MNYGIISNDKAVQTAGNNAWAGFLQWRNVFQGRIIPAGEALSNLNGTGLDIIHIRLCRENLMLIEQLIEQSGQNIYPKVVLSLDIPVQYWDREFGRPELLIAAVKKAGFVFAAQYPAARALEKLTGRSVYEIPYPVNLPELEKYQNTAKRDGITILGGGYDHDMIRQHIIFLRLFLPSRVPVRILSWMDFRPDDMAHYRRWNIDLIKCQTNDELCWKLAESRFVIMPETDSGYGNEAQNDEPWLVFCALTGSIVLGGRSTDGMYRCYPEIISTPLPNHVPDHPPQKGGSIGSYCRILFYCALASLWYRRLNDDALKVDYLTGHAKVNAEYYYWQNPPQKFFNLLSRETSIPQPEKLWREPASPSIMEQIAHVYGPESISYHHQEFVVVCLVKNGAEYIRTFMDHYNRLGARHFFFIDNGSTDETVAFLMQYSNVTLYRTGLPHKKYECEIRRAIIEKHSQNNWCLCVDIDELFDYPYSNRVSMRDFLRYLNTHHYTAVLSYLLDMFSSELVFSANPLEADRVGQYCFYDLSHIHKTPYHKSFFAFTRDNRLADPAMKSYSGGIRAKVFKNQKSGYLLTKHPLIFVDAHLEPMVHPHFCNKAFIADVNGVLKHYKFISSFKNKVISSLASKDYNYYGEQEHKEYFNIIQDKNRLRLYSRKSKKLKNIGQLVHQKFLKVSNMYRTYAKSIVSLKQGTQWMDHQNNDSLNTRNRNT
jgi:hypothetical protein